MGLGEMVLGEMVLGDMDIHPQSDLLGDHLNACDAKTNPFNSLSLRPLQKDLEITSIRYCQCHNIHCQVMQNRDTT
jgi:hypothetical protein